MRAVRENPFLFELGRGVWGILLAVSAILLVIGLMGLGVFVVLRVLGPLLSQVTP